MNLSMSLLPALLLALASTARAADAATVCVYDPAGRTGFMYKMAESWAVNAQSWGASVELRPYTDEATAVNDFTAGSCDGVMASGVRIQRYNVAAYTVEAVGGVPDYALLKPVLTALQTKSAYAPIFDAGDYETVGIWPLGAVYVMVRDRSFASIGAMSGKRIASLDYDKAGALAIQRMGGIGVAADLATLGPAFNNGELDVVFLPATAYTPFELWHGIGDKGGIITSPLLQVTYQVLVHNGKFPEGFGTKSRAYVAGDFDTAMKAIQAAEDAVPATSWITPTPAAQAELDSFSQKMRLELRDQQHSYDGRVLSLLKKARCNADPARAECAQNLE
ncbi:MAG: hypothetical protein GXP62_12675 [Oligoflexia bacterium]|nr:hypothetical protein [Oligoflexia bacterium]